VEAFSAEADPEKRLALWADVQKAMYEEIPYMKIGDFNGLTAKAKKVEGVDPAPWPYFWNASIKK
jgi:peptide/nickel transport system substrate-binding protein